MSRASEFQAEYGLICAGAVNGSLVASLPGIARTLGPLAGVSFRVASRMANGLGAGTAARSAADLDGVRVVFFFSPEDQFSSLLEALRKAPIRWHSKSLIFVDCEYEDEIAAEFRGRGASVGGIRRCPIPGRLVVDGDAGALALAHRLAKDMGIKAIELNRETTPAFEAALTLSAGTITPLIDQVAGLLRKCDVRDTEATRLAAGLFEQTAREYACSGRQSWMWHVRGPEIPRLWASLGTVGNRLRRLVGELILFGLDEAERHAAEADELRAKLAQTESGD